MKSHESLVGSGKLQMRRYLVYPTLVRILVNLLNGSHIK